MTAHVNEYNPRSSNPTNGVQTDPQKLKFNNVKSCIAVGVVPHAGNQLIGVHFTIASTRSEQEMDIAFATIKTMLAGSACDVYLVAAWGFHSTTSLLKKLKKLASTVHLCDVTPNTIGEADVDVKMDKNGASVLISVREHALYKTGDDGQKIVKAKYAAVGAVLPNFVKTGKSKYEKDTDSKQWIRVQPIQIYPGR